MISDKLLLVIVYYLSAQLLIANLCSFPRFFFSSNWLNIFFLHCMRSPTFFQSFWTQGVSTLEVQNCSIVLLPCNCSKWVQSNQKMYWAIFWKVRQILGEKKRLSSSRPLGKAKVSKIRSQQLIYRQKINEGQHFQSI